MTLMKISGQFYSFIFVAALLGVLVSIIFNAESSQAGESGNADKGKTIFEGRTCVDCHKDGGNLLKPSKPIKGSAFDKKYKDDAKLIQAIRKGVPGTSMRAFGADEISDADMKDLVAYIRNFSNSSSKKSK